MEYFDLPLFPPHSVYTFGVYLDVFGGFSKFSMDYNYVIALPWKHLY